MEAVFALLAALIVATGGVIGVWINGQSQRRIANDARKHDDYIEVLRWLYRAIDLGEAVIGDESRDVSVDLGWLEAQADETHRARALSAVGSREVRARMAVVRNRFIALRKLESPFTVLDRAERVDRQQRARAALHDANKAVQALEEQITAELSMDS